MCMANSTAAHRLLQGQPPPHPTNTGSQSCQSAPSWLQDVESLQTMKTKGFRIWDSKGSNPLQNVNCVQLQHSYQSYHMCQKVDGVHKCSGCEHLQYGSSLRQLHRHLNTFCEVLVTFSCTPLATRSSAARSRPRYAHHLQQPQNLAMSI